MDRVSGPSSWPLYQTVALNNRRCGDAARGLVKFMTAPAGGLRRPALRRTPCSCYKFHMGTQGLRDRAESCGRDAKRARYVRFPVILTGLALLPALVACSGSSSSTFGGPQQSAAMPPPPNAAMGPAGQPGAAAAPGPAIAAAAPPPAAQPANQGSMGHVDFLSMFRDPPSQTTTPPPPGATGIYPSQSLVDLFKSNSAPSTAAAPNSAAAPNTAASARNANMPHPPGTYTPSGQPYTPPPGQPDYGAAPAAVPAAAPPAGSNQASVGGVYPQQSLVDIFKRDAGAQ